MDSVTVVTLGCRVGRADADSLAASLPPGFRMAGPGDRVDWVVVSTCAVTGDAAASSRQAVRRAARDHPEARIVVSGCEAAVQSTELGSMAGVVAVVGPADHRALPALLRRLRAGVDLDEAFATARAEAPTWDAQPEPGPGRTRPVLKVQDGCDDACAYCIVPSLRGPSRSLPLADCVARIAALGRACPEVVLSGVHLGSWGRDLRPASSLSELVRAAAAGSSVPRVRLSSVEPLELPVDLLAEDAGRILCPHFHLPLQSGSDRVLGAMGRPYDAAAYARVVTEVFRLRPGAAIGADVITGFPGESERDHRATVALVASLPLAYLHVFPYSPRPGTPAASLPDRVSPATVEQRVAELREASARLRARFLASLEGRILEVVVERVKGGEARGTSAEFARVRFPAKEERRGALARVRVGDPGVSLDSFVEP